MRLPHLRHDVTPQQLPVPSALAMAMDEAVRLGSQDAAAWTSAHPNASAGEFDDAVPERMPPVPSVDVQQAELRDMHDIAASRTDGGVAFAREFAAETGRTRWATEIDLIGRTHGPEQARHARALLERAMGRLSDVVDDAKAQFTRPRPYVVDPTLTVVVPLPGGNPSYPSGHAAAAWTAALVLASLAPERSEELHELARSYAFSRVYGGVHFPSDVIAGARLGAQVAADAIRRDAVARTATRRMQHAVR